MEKTSYKAVILEKFKGDIKIGTRELRELSKGEVLIEIKCATIHPADFAFLSGTYGGEKPSIFPIVPGLEGCGKIIKVSEDLDQSLVGKKATAWRTAKDGQTFDGVWAELFIAKLTDIFIFDDKIPYETLCFATGNPLTAIGFLADFRKKGCKSLVINGASGAFGKMFVKLCIKEGIDCIAVVRRKDHFDYFEKIGAKNCISTSDQDWEQQLKDLATKLDARVLFECNGGEMTGKFVKAMPKRSTIYHFGNLELKRLGELDPKCFIFEEKTMEGWWLFYWMLSVDRETILNAIKYIEADLQRENSIFKSNYTKDFSLDDIEPAFAYYIQNPSEGKIILRPNK